MRAALKIGPVSVLILAVAILAWGARIGWTQDITSKPDVPQEARDRPNPIPSGPKSLDEGEKLFSSQCAMCHGTSGDGTGDLAVSLKMDVPDLTDPEVQGHRTDGELFYIITSGHKRMPADGERFSADLRWHMVNYIRTLRSGGGSR